VRGGILWGGRSSPGVLQRPLAYFILGAALIAFAAVLFITTHPSRPVRIDSQVAHYTVLTKDGKYWANHLTLTKDSTVFAFDATDYQPTLPARLQLGAPITVWVDEGGTNVLAIELAGETYSKHEYRDPNFRVEDDRHAAEAIAAIGLVFIGIGFLVRWVMNRRTPPAPPVPETERYTIPEGRGRLVQ
jgi:hypothetical protein